MTHLPFPEATTYWMRVGRVCTPTETLEDAVLCIEGGRIGAVGPQEALPIPPGAAVVDLPDLCAVPGFLDLQVNGGFGCDFTEDPACIPTVARRLPAFGVTAFLPTVISSPPETVRKAVEAVQSLLPEPLGARVLGLHLEGPFLNPQQAGAHNPAHFRLPSLEALADLGPLGPVRLFTLAPELPGADEVIRDLRRQGIVVAAGHTMATYDEALHALDEGVALGTHLFSAMRPLHHRDPGIVGALLTDPRATVSLIPDGVHMHPAVVRLVWQAKGPGKVCAVTDAMAALGMPPGRYRLGDMDVQVDGRAARAPSGLLAGSTLAMDQGVRNLMAFTGCALAEALQTVTLNPARLLGLEGRLGRIAPGCLADLVLLDRDLRVVGTLVGGQTAYWAPRDLPRFVHTDSV